MAVWECGHALHANNNASPNWMERSIVHVLFLDIIIKNFSMLSFIIIIITNHYHHHHFLTSHFSNYSFGCCLMLKKCGTKDPKTTAFYWEKWWWSSIKFNQLYIYPSSYHLQSFIILLANHIHVSNFPTSDQGLFGN